MNTAPMLSESEKAEHNRVERLKTRRYFLVSLSDRTLDTEEDYRCYKCGHIITNTFTEPHSTTEIKVSAGDNPGLKMMGVLCKKDNIMYIFA